MLIIFFAAAAFPAAGLEMRLHENGSLVPYAASSTAEAVRARELWPAENGTVEFVHIHKCGGMTFNHVAPYVICGASCDDCCLVRPDKIEERLNWTVPPKFISAREELNALPWSNLTFKTVMVRRPFERWVSEMMYKCRTEHVPPVRVEDIHKSHTWAYHSFVKNRIAREIVPQTILGDRMRSGLPLEGSELGVALGALYAFAFVGVVEHYDRSMCLFARTFGARDRVCELCCDRAKTPVVNGRDDTDDCRVEMYGMRDFLIYNKTHQVDYQIYDLASRVFEDRWRLAQAQGWGATEQACGCAFHPVVAPLLRSMLLSRHRRRRRRRRQQR